MSSHRLYIFSHVVPSRRILRSFSVSNSDQIAPNWYFTPKIIIVLSCHQILACIGSHDPTVIQSRNNLSFFCMNMRKIWINEWKLITITTIFGFHIMIFYFSKNIINYFVFPFILYCFYPSIIEFFDSILSIALLIIAILIFPLLFDIYNFNSSSPLSKTCAILRYKIQYNLTWVFGEYILRWGSWRDTL